MSAVFVRSTFAMMNSANFIVFLSLSKSDDVRETLQNNII
jgi:hypothetical protein